MADEEGVDLACPFAGQNRAYCIDQSAARPDQLGGDVEQALLDSGEALEPLGREAPAAFRVAPPCAAARARRIDQDEVGRRAKIGKLGELAGWAEQARFDAGSGACCAGSELRQARAVAVGGEDEIGRASCREGVWIG